MGVEGPRTYSAGQSIEDQCRACHADRMHTIIVVDERRQPLRVSCGFCGSDHNYRGGPRDAPRASASVSRMSPSRPAAAPLPLVSEREISEQPAVSLDASGADLERLLRQVIREEAGLTAVAPAEKWRGGDLVLRPGKSGLQDKVIPIETFFHKIVMLRNRLRMLEQQVNVMEIPEDAKLKLQGYITGCYGSLTSFNILFANDEDRFEGASQDA